MCELPNGNLVTMDNAGTVRIWQVNPTEIYKAAQTWKQMVGVDQKVLSVIYETEEDRKRLDEIFEQAQNGEGGDSDAKCETNGQGQGSGGDSGVGEGDGGSGSGGQGGGGVNGSGNNMNEDGRQEASFEDIDNLKLKTSGDEPREITEAQKEMHDQAMEKMLTKLDMTQADFQVSKKCDNIMIKNYTNST
jgi:hypothetical protein